MAQRSVCLSAYGSEKESLRICLKDDLHSSSCLDARISLVDVGCLKDHIMGSDIEWCEKTVFSSHIMCSGLSYRTRPVGSGGS